MVKYCIDKYPMGSFPGQKSPGKYMDGTLYENVKIMARNIVRDMTFMGVASSSTLEVGTGKSCMLQQIGEAYTEMVNKEHGLNLNFSEKNIVFRPEKLIEVAQTLPKYSCIIMDEWDEKSYFDKLAIALRQFFRKCRQLNLFMLIIIPDFFQLPKGYAISRSAFFIDVKFAGEFQRGFFDFYNFERKKDLYVKGKKTYNYRVSKPNFSGRFTDGYAIPKELYLSTKLRDLAESERSEKLKPTEKDVKSQMFETIYKNMDGISVKKLAEACGVSERTGNRYLAHIREEKPLEEEKNSADTEPATPNSNNLTEGDEIIKQ